MYGIGNDPFGGRQDQGGQYGNDLGARIMAAEYNLAVQRNDAPQAAGIFARLLGQWLQNMASR